MEHIDRIVIEVEQRSKSNAKRLDRLEETTVAVQELATSIKLMAQNLERMTEEQEKQGARLEKLEAQPGERWNTMTRTIFTTIVSAIAGGIVGILAMAIK